VAVLAVDESQRLILVEQFRKPLERIIFEIPAGKLEQGEAPLACAVRELKEETGYTAKRFTHLASFYTSPGFADELIHLFWAEDLQPGEAQPDQDEFIKLHHVSLDEAWAMITDGRIMDAKTILAVYAWANHLLQEKLK
jgi:ADP-ribose pyrophosphatase